MSALTKSPEGHLLFPNAFSKPSAHLKEREVAPLVAGYEDLIFDAYTSTTLTYAIGKTPEGNLLFCYIPFRKNKVIEITLPADIALAVETVTGQEIGHARLWELLEVIYLRLMQREQRNEAEQEVMSYIAATLEVIKQPES
jgi:hypothetical protein